MLVYSFTISVIPEWCDGVSFLCLSRYVPLAGTSAGRQCDILALLMVMAEGCRDGD